jgi:mono/diheme cytochrome c family protein
MNTKHAPFMLFSVAALLLGLWAALLRMGWNLSSPYADFALAHGVLMIGGFLGTLINLERAVALHSYLKDSPARQLPYLAPLFSAGGALALALDLSMAALLITLSSLGMVLMFAYIVWQQKAIYTLTMALGAFAWLVGNLLWLNGEAMFRSAPWWMAFLILTIAGERLELSRLMRPPRHSFYLFAVLVAGLLLGLGLTSFDFGLGMRLMGLSNLALALWLGRYDVIRRTLFQQGLPRFIAVCLALGYIWLGLSGLMAVYYGDVRAGLAYDAILHTVFLGFAFSMIFGHAPIILPAVLNIDLRYSALFYVHLGLLHLSLLLRVGGDLLAEPELRMWGGMLNALVLLLFMANTARSLYNAEGRALLWQTRPGRVVSALGFCLLALGLAWGLWSQLRPTDPPQENPSEGPAISQAELDTGERLYRLNCSACHAVNLRGVTGIGKNMHESQMVKTYSPEALVAFVIQGRPTWDADNTTGLEMPARGGNPNLTDEEIGLIVAYIRAETSD